MTTMATLGVKIRQGETPAYAQLKRLGKAALHFSLPVPNVILPVYRMIDGAATGTRELLRKTWAVIYRDPVFRSKCERVGKRLRLEEPPNVSGPVRVSVGDDVYLSGKIGIAGGRVYPECRVAIGDRTFIGHLTTIMVAQEVVIGADVLIAGDCMIADYSQHPTDPELRVARAQPARETVRPVRIKDKAWLGKRAVILPGVTVGEGAVVGAGTVVTRDVPDRHICVGNPGRCFPIG